MIESSRVRLRTLFAQLDGCIFSVAADPTVSSLAYRADQVSPGGLFFCVSGFRRDGHDFAPEAVRRGASALCVERMLDLPVPQVVVSSVRGTMGPVAAAFYGFPTSRLAVAGITGTNGKTTSAFLLAHLLDSCGLQAGLLGTIERRLGGISYPASRTTPEAVELQRDFAEMAAGGDRAVAMEVSSHALDLHRVRGIDFRAVAFTNLTQDHLDFHQTLEAYFEAKCRLFLDASYVGKRPSLAVINVDDPFGRRLASRCAPERMITFSSSTAGEEWGPTDLQVEDVVITSAGTRGTLVARGAALRNQAPDDRVEMAFSSRLVGHFNVANTLTAVGLGLGLNLSLAAMVKALPRFGGVPGRMEAIDAGQDFVVLVDYAHTPDSVRNVLETARAVSGGRVIAVMGCGGDRDRGKRPLMGREGERAADVVFLTSDNPRSEDPRSIVEDMLLGFAHPTGARIEIDRRRAIENAIAEAGKGDVVMVLGKGHETGQELAHEKVAFDDRQVVRDALERLAFRSSR